MNIILHLMRPIIEYTNEVVYLEDNEIAIVNKNEDLHIKTIDNQIKTPYVQQLALSLETIEKGGILTLC